MYICKKTIDRSLDTYIYMFEVDGSLFELEFSNNVLPITLCTECIFAITIFGFFEGKSSAGLDALRFLFT